MKKLTTAAILLGGTLLVSQSGFAQTVVPDDLYLGFQNSAGGATQDYIINLGAASGIVGGNSVVDLSSALSSSDFNAVLGSSSSMMGGVVGGNQNGNATTPYDLYATQLRLGGSFDPSVPGSDLSGVAVTYQTDSSAFAALGNLNAPAAGAGVLDSTKSWQDTVENGTQTPNTFWGNSGINPDSPVGNSSVVYEDLWHTSSSGDFSKHPFEYLGYFTLDAGSSPSLTFTPSAAPVPEPAVSSLLGGAGCLLFFVRRFLNHKKA